MDIVGIDFETANRFRNSACQVGAVLVQDGRVVDTYMSLIRPPGNFEAINIAVHGITASKVRSAPTLAAIWPTLKAFLGRAQRISAHNATFDRGVLKASLAAHGIALPTYAFECTVARARTVLPHLADHKLPTVCRALGVPLLDHHDALADATAAGLIAHALDRHRPQL